MLLKLENLIRKYDLKITGVIQAGAHEGQEVWLFKRLRVNNGYFFEPCIRPFRILASLPVGGNYTYYQIALSDHEGYEVMNAASYDQSSSLLKPKFHLVVHPNITFEGSEMVMLRTLDSFKITNCNLLVIDVQGYELSVLRGAKETLKTIDYVYIEVNKEELYEGCSMVEDVDDFLSDFTRVETKWGNKGYGDALYLKKTLL